MEYFLIQRLKGEVPGHPIFFEYSLDRVAAGENDRESSVRVFFTSYRNSPLVFVCKHPKIEFDYYDIPAGEYFVSARFAEIAVDLNVPDLASIDVQLLSSKRKPISSKAAICIHRRVSYTTVYVKHADELALCAPSTEAKWQRSCSTHEPENQLLPTPNIEKST